MNLHRLIIALNLLLVTIALWAVFFDWR